MRKKQRGAMFVLGALLILPLMAFAILALDIGRAFIVRNELQNVADAAALAGANCLTRLSDPASASECLPTISPALNWTRATAKAQSHLTLNAADNFALATGVVQVGYWNLCPPAVGCPAGLTGTPSGGAFNTGFAPITSFDKPAVKVTVTKDAGVNGGPIAMLTDLIFNWGAPLPMSAAAVAVISSPAIVQPAATVPQVINSCMFDKFWDTATGTPKIYRPDLGDVDPWGLSVAGQPWEVRIGSSYHYGTCASGQWTTFDLNSNSANDVRNLIASGNPSELDIGDNTWIKPGTVSADYQALDAKFPTPPGGSGWDVTVLVVNAPGDDLSIQGPLPIVAFAGFHIDDIKSTGGSPANPGFYIQGHFIPVSVAPGGGVGPFFGAYTPPRLSQ